MANGRSYHITVYNSEVLKRIYIEGVLMEAQTVAEAFTEYERKQERARLGAFYTELIENLEATNFSL